MSTTYRIEMTESNGTKVFVGSVSYASRDEAHADMVRRRALGEFTEGRDAYGSLLSPNATRVVEVES